MMFVKDSLIPSIMSGNFLVDEEEQSLTHKVTDNESDIDSSFVDVLSPSTSTMFSQTTYPKPTKVNKKRRNVNESTQKLLDLEEKKIAILQNAQEREKKTYDDPDAQFLLSFLPYIKELNSLEKLEVRSQIQSVVLNAYKKKSHRYTPFEQQLHETNKDSRQEYTRTQDGPSKESEIKKIYRPYNEEIHFSTPAAPLISEPAYWVSSYSSMDQSKLGSVQSIDPNTLATSTTIGTQYRNISLDTNPQYSLFDL